MAVLDEAGAPMRFSRVLQQVKGVSQKSLTKTLRLLQQDGLVNSFAVPFLDWSSVIAEDDLRGHFSRFSENQIRFENPFLGGCFSRFVSTLKAGDCMCACYMAVFPNQEFYGDGKMLLAERIWPFGRTRFQDSGTHA